MLISKYQRREKVGKEKKEMAAKQFRFNVNERHLLKSKWLKRRHGKENFGSVGESQHGIISSSISFPRKKNGPNILIL